MEESITYKCPGCGSAISFNYEKNKWICEYCHNTYDNLFISSDNSELKNIDEYVEYYYYYCDNCDFSYYSKQKQMDCYRCQKPLKGIKDVIGGTITTKFSDESAKRALDREFEKYSKLLPSVYFDNYDLYHESILCDLYNGSIIVTDGIHTMKFLFVNTVIPRIETHNFKILYDFANTGFDSLDNFIIDPKYNYVVDKKSHDCNNDYDVFKMKLLDACKFAFIKDYGLSQNIHVTDSLGIKRNVLYKTYYAKFNVDKEEYRSYVLGERKTSYGTKEITTAVEFPKIKDMDNDKVYYLINKCNKLGFLFSFLSILFLVFCTFFLNNIIDNVLASIGINYAKYRLFTPIIFSIFAFIMIIIVALAFRFFKLSSFYKKTIRVTERDFYYNLVTNSNFVKKVG